MMASPSPMAAANRCRRSTKGAGSNGLIGAIIQRRRGSVPCTLEWRPSSRTPARRARTARSIAMSCCLPIWPSRCFESIWGVEHHFTDYTMCPDVLQFLTYMAGRTERARLGSMVVVLPWHDPMRVAEEEAMLDNISGGRLILGLGRGAGKVEFDGFRLSMDESRQRFVECAEMLLQGLETGYCEYKGQFIQQPRAAIRPAPFKSFRGRAYAAAVSPDSMPVIARLGVGLLIIPQKPWAEVARELDTYRGIYREVNGEDAPPPVSAGWVFCDPSADRAREMARRWIGGYYLTVLDHYQFAGDHLTHTKGYEYYGKMSEKIAQYGTDRVIDYFTDLQVYGTPEQCFEKILDVRNRVGNS